MSGALHCEQMAQTFKQADFYCPVTWSDDIIHHS